MKSVSIALMRLPPPGILANICLQLSALALCALATTTLAVSPIVVQEQEFVDSGTNGRFMIIGVDYQPGGQGAYGTGSGDPLSNATICLRE